MQMREKGVGKDEVIVSSSELSDLKIAIKEIYTAVSCIQKGVTPHLLDSSGMIGGKGVVVDGRYISVQELAMVPIASKRMTEDDKFGCSECDKVFPTEVKLNKHLKGHRGEGKYFCEEAGCGKRYLTKSSLSSHAKSHAPGFPCEVEGCRKVYSHKASLIRHGLYDHPAEGDDAPSFDCDHCGDSFTRRHDRDVHSGRCEMNPHPVSYECRFGGCGKVFKTLKIRARHQTSIHKLPSDVRL